MPVDQNRPYAENLASSTENRIATIRALLASIHDPEIPVLTIMDLGIVRNIEIGPGSTLCLTITPTYSGCPAIEAIRREIFSTLMQAGFPAIQIINSLSPPWSSDWISEKGKEKLKSAGIAPPLPGQQVCHTRLFHKEEAIPCPHCNSFDTRLVRWFSSTPCKAVYQCESCHAPFDYFKAH